MVTLQPQETISACVGKLNSLDVEEARCLRSQEGRAIAAELRRRQEQMRIAIIKVSFVPDHVHLAIRLHPTVSPAQVVAALMNAAQDIVQDLLVREGLERECICGQLWRFSKPSNPQIHSEPL